MTIEVKPPLIQTRAGGRPRRPGRGGQSRLNTTLSVLLVGLVALAPIPFGGTPPFFVALFAALLGLAAKLYLLVLLLRGEALRMPPGRIPHLLIPFLAFVGFILWQLLPITAWRLPLDGAGGVALDLTTASLAPGDTVLSLLQVLSYGLFFLLMLQVAVNRSRARRLGLALFFVVCAHALYGLLALTLLGDRLLLFPKIIHEGYATGSFLNRNSYATFLAFGLVLGVLYGLREWRTGDRQRLWLLPMLLAGIGIIIAAILASGSRMGLVAALAGALCAVVMAVAKSEHTDDGGGRWRWLILIVLPLVVGIGILYGASTLERLGTVEDDAGIRAALYEQVIALIARFPWTGIGMGTFEAVFPLFQRPPLDPDLVWNRAHSTYLGLWVEAGLVAGSLPLLLVGLIGIEAAVIYLRRHGDLTAPAAAVCVVVVAAVHSLVDFSLEIEANALLFLAILALGLARGGGVTSSSERLP